VNPSKKNIQLMRWRLLGKELRQLLPLFVALPLAFVAFAGLIPVAEFLSRVHGTSPWELAFPLPGVVFSIGAVGLLVCQEKEHRSLNWLAGLPIPAVEIVRSKLLAGIIGTVLVWVVSILALLALQFLIPVDFEVFQWLQCLSINLYILFAGFAIVWRFESTFASLLLLLPAAFVPAALAQGIDAFVFPTTRGAMKSDFTTSIFLLLCYLTLGTIALYLLHRWGVRTLSATPTRAVDGNRVWVPYQVETTIPKQMRLMSPTTGLTWQMVHQNRLALMLIGLLFVGSWVPVIVNGVEAWNVSALVGAVAVSWLGVVTFGGDSFRNQVRFLADRGVSRWHVWWTRQLAPLSIFSLYCLLALGAAVFGYMPSGYPLGAGGLLFLQVVVIGLAGYAVSQWLAQQIPSAILATVIVPPVSLGCVGFLIMLTDWLGIDWLYLAIVAILPMVGTWWAMPAWMDRRLGMRHTLTQLSIASLMSLIGAAFLAAPLWTPPSMDPTVAAEIQAFRQLHEAGLATSKPRHEYRDPNSIPSMAHPTTNDSPSTQTMEEEVSGQNATRSYRDRLLAELSRIERELSLADHALSRYLYQLDGGLLEMLAELVPHWTMPPAERNQLFTRLLRAHFQLTRRVRQSHQLHDQEVADIGEIWLLHQLLNPETRQLLDDDSYNEIVSYLSNADGRQVARRRAIVTSWEGLEQEQVSVWRSDQSQHFSGIYIPVENRGTALWSNHQRKQRAIDLLEILWSLSAKTGDIPDEVCLQLAKTQGVPEVLYGRGDLGRYYRIDDAANFIPDMSAQYGWGTLGRQMGAGWELQAKQLRLRERQNGTAELESESRGARE
jgi:hypothetical protein